MFRVSDSVQEWTAATQERVNPKQRHWTHNTNTQVSKQGKSPKCPRLKVANVRLKRDKARFSTQSWIEKTQNKQERLRINWVEHWRSLVGKLKHVYKPRRRAIRAKSRMVCETSRNRSKKDELEKKADRRELNNLPVECVCVCGSDTGYRRRGKGNRRRYHSCRLSNASSRAKLNNGKCKRRSQPHQQVAVPVDDSAIELFTRANGTTHQSRLCDRSEFISWTHRDTNNANFLSFVTIFCFFWKFGWKFSILLACFSSPIDCFRLKKRLST